ncbi:MAG: hypothetical protein HRU28_01485 [Rhizobiales bacterium]|nr:hypothetical protein [Hyphomicrobiales bacterium]
MKKEMRTQIYRVIGVFSFLVMMTIWQLDFVITAVSSNVFLNMSIIGAFIFGVVLLYFNMRKMPNEILAFESLQEFHSDILTVKSGIELDDNWKYARCEKPPILFRKPEFLGQAYHMIYEQMARSNRLRVNTSTMQTLVDGLDMRLYDQKSLMQYITGLLVFLGLIGTFVGLMGTLASVGEIIGGLDLTNGAGVAVIQTLMTNLQKPLIGMATGFSSSLFGLITSLTLGLMSRFAAKHNDLLKMHFEDWLAGAAQLEEDDDFGPVNINDIQDNAETATTGGKSTTGGNALDHRDLRLLYRVAKNSVATNQKLNDQLEQLTQSVQNVADQRVKDQQEMANFAMQVANISKQQNEYGYLLNKTADAIAAQQATAYHIQKIDKNLEEKFSNFEQYSQAIHNQSAEQLRQLGTKLNQKFEEADHSTKILRSNIADEVRKIDTRVDNRLDAMHNGLERLGRNQFDQIEHLKQALEDQINKIEAKPSTDFAEIDDDKVELTQMMNQLDNMINVNQLSKDDVSELKNMSRLFTDVEATPEKPHSIKDLFDRIVDNYGEMNSKSSEEIEAENAPVEEEFAMAVGAPTPNSILDEMSGFSTVDDMHKDER